MTRTVRPPVQRDASDAAPSEELGVDPTPSIRNASTTTGVGLLLMSALAGFEGEHPAETVRREVKEELGLVIEDVELFDVFADEWSPNEWAQNTEFIASPGVAAVRPDPREVAEWGWFPVHELPAPMAIGHADRIAAWRGQHRPAQD